MILRKYGPFAVPLLSGLLLTSCFAPFNMWMVAWICLVPLLWGITIVRSGLASAAMGFATGLVFWLTSIPWITVVMQNYGDLPFPVALLLLLLLAVYLSLYPALLCWILKLSLNRVGSIALFMVPVLWATNELLITFVLTGFPWNLLGYSQVFFLPVIQIADVTGVYGVSFTLVLVNALIAFLFLNEPANRKSFYIPVIASGFVIVFVFVYGFISLSSQPEEMRKFRVALIQDEMTNEERLSADQQALFNYYIDSSREAAAKGIDLVIWGEGALLFLDMVGEGEGMPGGFAEQFVLSLSRDEKFWLLMGSSDYINNYSEIYNTAVTISPENDGLVSGRYAKVHLTPFGEYVPFGFIFGWLDKVVPEISNFKSGDKINTMPLLNGRVGTAICYEIIFPDQVRRFTAESATVLATISNDAWFGKTAANDQHFNMAIMRAVENRRYLLRCAVTGVSGIITPSGAVSSRSETYKRMVIEDEAAMMDGTTAYVMVGDLFGYVCTIAALGWVFWLRFTARKKRV